MGAHDGRISIEEAAKRASELAKLSYMAGVTTEQLLTLSRRCALVMRKAEADCQKTAKNERASKHRKRRNAEVGGRIRGWLSRLFPKNR